jgi:hypothetical protein
MAAPSYYRYRQAPVTWKLALVALGGAVALILASPAAGEFALPKPIGTLEAAAIGLAGLIGVLKVGTA